MAGGGEDASARELDQTPTWAFSTVCAVIVLISILLEKVLHKVGELFQERRKKALYEALQKVKTELMVVGFISLLLTFGQNYISKVCIPVHLAETMLPCERKWGPKDEHAPKTEHEGSHRRLLWHDHRFLAADSGGGKCKPGRVPLISLNGLHQLHILLFFLAVFHVIYSALTMMLGRLKIRGWKVWELEVINEHELMNDASRFRLTHETSFVKDHNRPWTKTPVSFYLVCFFRQFLRSVTKADYLTMRHGFISVHLAPGTKFNFQKYIKRSLEDDFKVVVGISPILWACVMIFLLLDVNGWHAMAIITLIPPIVILAVGTKLQGIITQMALEIQERHAVIQGIPLVQVSDRHFWFGRPQLVLRLIHFVLFQNAFEITYFFWIWYEFGLRSCFHHNFNLIIARVALGVGVQILCSYITLPLYALVTQMGSTMKQSVFDEQTSKALKQWHKNAKKKNEGKAEPMPTRTLGGSPSESPVRSPVKNPRLRPKSTGEVKDVEADTASPNQTANITASVDLNGDQQRQYGQHDLLTGP